MQLQRVRTWDGGRGKGGPRGQPAKQPSGRPGAREQQRRRIVAIMDKWPEQAT